MHFTNTLLALLSIIPLLAQADPESALQFKAVDLNRKRQASGGSYVSNYGQCLQVCDGYFPQGSASKASAATSSLVSSKSAAQTATSSSTKVSTSASVSTVTRTLTQTNTRTVTASASSTVVVVTQSQPVSTVKPTTVTTVSTTTLSKPTSSSSAQATSSSGSGTSPGGVTAAQKQEILTLHNDERAHYGASPLTWNTELESYAKTYASKCDWKHSGGPYGENLATAFGYPMPANGVNGWNDERSQYSPGAYSHWTQVVWKGTSEIGCALVTCANGLTGSSMPAGSQYLVCEYKAPGNVLGRFDANIGAKVA